jgi:hypothetical protein
MFYLWLADLVVLIHLAFIVFAVLGGLLIIWRRKVLYLHLAAVIWAGWIEFSGGICPLTPLENWLRGQGGQAAYAVDFVGNYLMPLVYPPDLTRGIQIVLATMVIFINGLIYGYLFLKHKKKMKFDSES